MSRLSIEQRFAEFEETAAPSFRPMGLSETISRVRLRRRRRRAAVALVAVVALAVPVAWFARPAPPSPVVAQRHVPMPDPEFGSARPTLSFLDARTFWAVFNACPHGGPGCAVAVMSTVDGGRNWRTLSLPPLPFTAEGLEVYILDRNTFSLRVLGWPGGFLLTRDGGERFESYPKDRPPVEAMLARGGLYQALCPNATGFADNVCLQQQVLRIGDGPIPFVLPWQSEAGTNMEIRNAADGRLWLFEHGPNGRTRLAVSADNTATWQVIPDLPDGAFTLSPDGREAWVIGYGVAWELRDHRWHSEGWPMKPGTQISAAALGDGLLLVANGDGMAYLKGGRLQPIPGVKSGIAGNLADGTAVVWTVDGFYVGTGTATDRHWTLLN